MINWVNLFLFLWAIVATFFAYENPKIQKLLSLSQTSETGIQNFTDLEKEYNFIFNFIPIYYNFEKRSDYKTIYQLVKNFVSPESQNTILDGYKENLKFLKDKNYTRSVVIHKILRNKSNNTFLVYAKIETLFKNSKNHQYEKIEIKVNSSLKESHKLKISKFKEILIEKEDDFLKDKTIFIDKSLTSRIKFPCSPNSIQTILNKDGLEYKNLSKEGSIHFYSTKKHIRKSSFKTICKKIKFKIDLTSNKKLITLYQRLERSDGVLIRKKLTEDEKFKKIIEEQLGIKLIDK